MRNNSGLELMRLKSSQVVIRWQRRQIIDWKQTSANQNKRRGLVEAFGQHFILMHHKLWHCAAFLCETEMMFF